MVDRSLWVQAGLWTATLAASVVLYVSEHALEHFLWHLSYGGAFGLLVGAGWMRCTGRARGPASLWAWLGYVYMIVPDLIWIAPRLGGGTVHPHRSWMDLFLGHVFLDTWSWTNHLLVPAVLVGVAAFWSARRWAQARPSDRAGR